MTTPTNLPQGNLLPELIMHTILAFILAQAVSISELAARYTVYELEHKAQAGDVEALAALGYAHVFGIRVDVDCKRAALLLKEAAEKGSRDASFYLAGLYETGRGVRRDIDEAARWYLHAAERGDATAQYWMGRRLAKGEDRVSREQSFKWFLSAAKSGHKIAQTKVGDVYMVGGVVRRDIGKAAEWYRKAAEGGFPDALDKMGALHEHGYIGAKNLAEAYKWYYLMHLCGYEDAFKRKAHLKDLLTEDQRTKAETDARAVYDGILKCRKGGQDKNE